ncbi:MAG: glycoside hydrolase family 97 protein [Aequoribacter sp.]|jgi:alpha-glucosidase|uniref:glycoside hydrolase family 97 protein n=1 Tax=Aequoribacter sp. TaxID=2847771 RepID=UPI003C44EE3E
MKLFKQLDISTPLCLALATLIAPSALAESYKLASPDGTIVVTVNYDASLSYSVAMDGQTVLQPSKIDLLIKGQTSLKAPTRISDSSKRHHEGTLHPEVRVKSAIITDEYNQLSIQFSNSTAVSFRAYDNGVAYRFSTNFDHPITITSEQAEFNFDTADTVYFAEEESFYSHNERSYIPYAIGELTPQHMASTPDLIQTKHAKVLITESSLRDYAGIWLKGSEDGTGLRGTFANYPTKKVPEEGAWVDRNEPVVDRADYIAKTTGKRDFPWRILAIARDDGDLLTNQLSYQLAIPNQAGDTSWIKPGKVAWDWYNANNIFGVDFEAGLNTETYKYYIDFAADYGIEYVILDEGWYPLGNLLGTVENFDVPEVIAHAKSKGVGIILWASWLTLRDQFDEAMDRFAELGAVGIKPDFFQRDDQEMVNFYWKIAAAAAERKMLVDFHGSYKPAGLRRSYPNVISREGVKGLEWNKWSYESTAEHNTTLPFIRMVAGPMDYTPGAMSNALGPKAYENLQYKSKEDNHQDFTIRFTRPMSQTSRVHQMAMLTVFESPLQMMADSPSRYREEHECASFMAKVPTVWDDTRVIHGKLGDYVSVARKSGNTWFVGTLTDEHSRELPLPLNFLEKDTVYDVEIFEDGRNADKWAEDYKTYSKAVTSKDVLAMKLAPAGGFTARFTPRKP